MVTHTHPVPGTYFIITLVARQLQTKSHIYMYVHSHINVYFQNTLLMHTLTPSLTHTHTFSLAHSLSHSHTHSHTHSYTFSLTHTHTLTLSLTRTLLLTHTPSLSHRKVFFRQWFEVTDFVFIVSHTLLTISYIVVYDPDPDDLPLRKPAVLCMR